MQILAVVGIVGAFASICGAICLLGRRLQRSGRNFTLVDPSYPDSMQAQSKADLSAPGRPYLQEDTSLAVDGGSEKNPKPQHEESP